MTGDDHARLGDEADELVTFLGNQAFMRLVGDEGTRHCVALVVDPRDGTFLCKIYDRRPAICRDLARGSGACEGERHGKRGRALRALAVLR